MVCSCNKLPRGRPTSEQQRVAGSRPWRAISNVWNLSKEEEEVCGGGIRIHMGRLRGKNTYVGGPLDWSLASEGAVSKIVFGFLSEAYEDRRMRLLGWSNLAMELIVEKRFV